MVKTTLYLPDELKRALERVARQRGISEAHLYREALQRVADSAERPRPRFPYFASGNSEPWAERDEDLLAESGFGEC
jgi:hypothetical protein